MSSLQSDLNFEELFGLYNPACRGERHSLEQVTPGFSGGTVFKCVAPVGPLAIHLWPETKFSPGRWNSISKLLSHIHSEQPGLVAVPIKNAHGSVCSRVGNRWIHLEPWLPGQPCVDHPSPPQLTNAIKALAAWHMNAANYVPDERDSPHLVRPHRGHSHALKSRLRLLKQALQPGAAEDVAARAFVAGQPDILSAVMQFQPIFASQAPALLQNLQQHAVQSLQNLLPLQPVLRDIWRDHVLFSDDKVTGLIDPAACSTDSVLNDLTRLLGSLVGSDVESWGSAITAYEQFRPLEQCEHERLLLFDHSNLLLSARNSLLRWISLATPAGGQHQETASQATRLQARFDEYVNRLQHYDQFQRHWTAYFSR